MKHQIIPCEDQTANPAIDRNDPLGAATAVELQFPKTFSKKAWRVIRYFEGAMYLYSYKGKSAYRLSSASRLSMVVIASQSADWRGNPPPGKLPKRNTDCHVAYAPRNDRKAELSRYA